MLVISGLSWILIFEYSAGSGADSGSQGEGLMVDSSIRVVWHVTWV